MKISTKITACALLCGLGFLGNWFKLTLFFNVDFLFGSFFAMLAVMTLGGTPGIIVAAVAGSCTFLLWHHPWAALILAAEAIFVAVMLARRKGNPVVYDIFYWLCVGMPLIYLFYHVVMGMQLQSTLLVMLKQSINGLFNLLLALIAIILFQFMQSASENRLPYSRVLFIVMVSLVLLPATLLMVSGVRTYQEKRTEFLEARVSATAEAARKILADWIQEHHRNVHILSTLVGNPNESTHEDMQHYVETFKAATPAFKGMGVFDRKAVTVAYSPLEEDGISTVGVDFSNRAHVAIMRKDKKPYITDVLMSKLGNPSPIVIFLAPIVISGEYEGYCSGVVEVMHVASLLRNLSSQGIQVTVVDGFNRTVVSSIPDLKTMAPFPRSYREIAGSADTMPVLWKPDPEPHTSPMQQWTGSFYYSKEAISENCPWKIVVEAPCMPLVMDISRYSISRLGLLGLLILFTLVLSQFLSKGLISGIAKLQRLTRSLPEHLDTALTIEWPRSRIEELDDLSGKFREMTDALLNDITKRKQAETALRNSLEEKTALLKEVHHRVKNNLQIVASLLSLQADRSTRQNAVDVLQDTRNRVRSMALLHETLYQSSNLARINFAVYLRDLCRQLALTSGPVADRVRIEFRISGIELPLELAVPCGLIVNELVSNALKHGFPEHRTGNITVEMNPADDQKIVLCIRDDGVGLSPDFDPSDNSTLGLQLVSGLAGQLGGRLETESRQEAGAAFRIVFPASKDTLNRKKGDS